MRRRLYAWDSSNGSTDQRCRHRTAADRTSFSASIPGASLSIQLFLWASPSREAASMDVSCATGRNCLAVLGVPPILAPIRRTHKSAHRARRVSGEAAASGPVRSRHPVDGLPRPGRRCPNEQPPSGVRRGWSRRAISRLGRVEAAGCRGRARSDPGAVAFTGTSPDGGAPRQPRPGSRARGRQRGTRTPTPVKTLARSRPAGRQAGRRKMRSVGRELARWWACGAADPSDEGARTRPRLRPAAACLWRS